MTKVSRNNANKTKSDIKSDIIFHWSQNTKMFR